MNTDRTLTPPSSSFRTHDNFACGTAFVFVPLPQAFLPKNFPKIPPCAERVGNGIICARSPREARTTFFDNRELEIKENYNSYIEIGAERSAPLRGRSFFAKRIRAHDGCLGIRRRRRTRKTATSHGEPSTGVDPWVSEWGNPAALTGGRRRMNQIVRRSYTRGSETSQYPKEERSNDIARVVASESAGAQTGKLASRGCGTGAWHRNG